MKKILFHCLVSLSVIFVILPACPGKNGDGWHEIPVKTAEFYSGNGIEGIPLHVDEPNGMDYKALPVTGGIPLPQGAVRDPARIRIVDVSRKEIPSQLSVSAAWPDGSIRWLLAHFQIDLAAGRGNTCFLEYGPEVRRNKFATPLSVNKADGAVETLTGPLKLTVDQQRGIRIFLDNNEDGKFSEKEAITSASLDSQIELRDHIEEAAPARGKKPDAAALEGWKARLFRWMGRFIHLKEERPEVRKAAIKQEADKQLGGHLEDGYAGLYRLIQGTNWEFSVEEEGPLRAVIKISGWHYCGEKKYSPTTLRIFAYAGKNYLRLDHTFINTADPAEVAVKSMALKVPLNLPGELAVSTELDDEILTQKPADKEVFIIQDNITPPDFPRYDEWSPRCRVFSRPAIKLQKTGKFSGGWLDISDKHAGMTLQVREFWKLHPKELYASKAEPMLAAYLWPGHGDIGVMDIRRQDQILDKSFLAYLKSDLGKFWYKETPKELKAKKHKLRQTAMGLARTHQLLLICHRGKLAASAMKELTQSFDRPPLIAVTPEWNCFTSAMGLVHPRDRRNFPRLEQKMEAHMEWLIKHQREWSHWFGIWNWGAMRYDYDAKSGHWLNDVKHWWNSNEIEVSHGLFLQYFRTCRRDYYELCESVARHAIDVETLHYLPALGLTAGGSRHHIDHWGDDRHNGCHCFTQGMTDYYFLTGDRRAQEVIMNYGRAASATPGSSYGREIDQNSRNILNAWEVSKGDMQMKAKMEKMLNHQLKGLEFFRDNKGELRIRNGGQDPDTGFRFSEYRLPYLVYAGVVTGNKAIADALAEALDFAFFDKYIQYRAADGFSYVYLNKERDGNWARAAAYSLRYLALGRGVLPPVPDKREEIKPDSFGGVFQLGGYNKLVAAMKGVYEARGINPEKDLNERQYLLRNYTVENDKKFAATQGFAFLPVDIAAYVNANPYDDPFRVKQQIAVQPSSKIKLEKGGTGFDFGSPDTLMPGWLPVTERHIYPSTGSKRITDLAMLPFGTTMEFLGIPFKLAAVSAEKNKGIIVLGDKEEVVIPIGRAARQIFFLGHVSGKPTVWDESGAQYLIRYEDGAIENIPLHNLKHYQYFGLGALYARELDCVCELNERWVNMFNVRPKDKKIKEICFRDTGKGHKVGLFGLTLEVKASEAPAIKWEYDFDLEKAPSYSPEQKWGWVEKERQMRFDLPDGNYRANLTIPERNPQGEYTDLWVNDELVLNTCYVLKQGGDIQFPVTVQGGCLKLEGKPWIFKRLRLAGTTAEHKKTSLPESSPSREIKYGWLPDTPKILGGVPDILANKETGLPSDWVLDDRMGAMNDKPAGNYTFAVQVENGEYLVRLFMGGWYVYKPIFVDILAEDKIVVEHADITANKDSSPAELKFKADVKDGRLDISIHQRPEDFLKSRYWMISGMILKRM